MPAGSGTYDAQGVWLYGEAQLIGTISDLLNIGQDSVSDAIAADRVRIAAIEAGASASYTPTLTGVTLGTTGNVNAATYTRFGKRVFVTGRIVLGTGGAITGTVTVSLPSTASLSGQEPPRGQVVFVDVGTGATVGIVDQNASSGTGAVRLLALNSGGTYLAKSAVSSTVPHTWAATDQLLYEFSYQEP